jgi:hypothetical protein
VELLPASFFDGTLLPADSPCGYVGLIRGPNGPQCSPPAIGFWFTGDEEVSRLGAGSRMDSGVAATGRAGWGSRQTA